ALKSIKVASRRGSRGFPRRAVWPSASTSKASCGALASRRDHQPTYSEQVVSRCGEPCGQLRPFHTAHARPLEPTEALEPAKDRFDPSSHDLARSIAGLPSGPRVDGRAVSGVDVLGD